RRTSATVGDEHPTRRLDPRLGERPVLPVAGRRSTSLRRRRHASSRKRRGVSLGAFPVRVCRAGHARQQQPQETSLSERKTQNEKRNRYGLTFRVTLYVQANVCSTACSGSGAHPIRCVL